MNIEEFRDYCLSLKGAIETTPFGPDTLVFKVGAPGGKEKMFAACSIDVFDFFNVKCDPEIAIDLRERYQGVRPGWHMNKKLWNSVDAVGEFSDELRRQWIKDSYDLIVASLPKKDQAYFE
jgi:predicted DNA-binding protein (MmcQ/YjbR family)